ncbi:PilN domain-containing protein [Desulfotruncus alcoholivorax]|uniref:PilN domain-containing protein n=1 Tax=Desulfotruncus alcoholivorax TaxID=265477 RepID=UPI0003F84BB3|nr:PilN domain-containing protein [Desulfotruncus alcoholivorax]
MYEINLLPPELIKRFNIDFKKLTMLIAVIIVVIGYVYWYAGFKFRLYNIKEEIAHTDKMLAEMSPRLNLVKKIKAERIENQEKIMAYKAITESRFLLTPVFKEIEKSIPVDTWLTGITLEYREKLNPVGGFASLPGANALPPKATLQAVGPPVSKKETIDEVEIPSPNVLMLQGVTYNSASVGVFVHNLAGLPYFRNVGIKKVYTNSGDDAGYAFTLELQLREEGRDVSAS